KGATTVTYLATDAAGNQTSATQVVTVDDTTPPTLEPPADATYECPAAVPAANATAADNCGAATVTVLESHDNGAGSATSPLHITRTFTATDGSGNTAQATQTITVADGTAPSLTAPAAVSRGTGPGAATCSAYVSDEDLGTASATDACGQPTLTRSGVPEGNLFPPGATTVTYLATDAAGTATSPLHITRTFTATDSGGNTAQATQTITVADGTAPSLTAPAAVSRGTGPGAATCSAYVSDEDLGT